MNYELVFEVDLGFIRLKLILCFLLISKMAYKLMYPLQMHSIF